MTFHFHGDALKEFENAVDFYETCRAGLGLEFAREVYVAIERILRFMKAWSQAYAGPSMSGQSVSLRYHPPCGGG